MAAASEKDLNRELRWFGTIVGGSFVLIFGLAAPYIKGRSYPLWPWILCAALWLSATLWPMALKPAHGIWTRAGRVMGAVNTRIVLAMIFYLIVTPLGLIRRLLAGDPMMRLRDASALSYRVQSRRTSRRRMENPY